jgi:hypothetical protein
MTTTVHVTKIWQPRTVFAAIFTVTLLLAHTRSAFAATAMYDGIQCQVQGGPAQSALVSKGTTSITNISSSTPVAIQCPVPKTTSGPGLTQDQITDVAVYVSGGPRTTVQTIFEVWFADGSSQTEQSPTAVALDNSTPINNVDNPNGWAWISTSTTAAVSNYWTPDMGLGYANQWLYAEMAVLLSPGASLDEYYVVENGPPQTTTIFPASICTPASDNKDPFTVGAKSNAPDGAFGSDGPSGMFFFGDAPPPADFQCVTLLPSGPDPFITAVVRSPVSDVDTATATAIGGGVLGSISGWPGDTNQPLIGLFFENPQTIGTKWSEVDQSGNPEGDFALLSFRVGPDYNNQ